MPAQSGSWVFASVFSGHRGARAQLALQKGSQILAAQVIRHNLYKDATKDPSEEQQIRITDAKSKLIKFTEAPMNDAQSS